MAETMETLGATLEQIFGALHDERLEPDPKRADWGQQSATIDELMQTFVGSVVTPFEELRGQLDDDSRTAVADSIAVVGSRLAGLLLASGRSRAGTGMLAKLAALASGELAEELRAGERDPDSYVAYVHGRYLVAHDQLDRARAAFDQAIAGGKEKVLVQVARDARLRAKPLTKAPELFRLNGFGLGMYGARDPYDGTHISTHCISALWIPILPLAAYRVIEHGDSYSFLSRAPLSAFAIWYRRAVLVAAVVLIAGASLMSYLDNPSRLAGKAFDAAQAAEQAGDIELAINGYETILAHPDLHLAGDVADDTAVALTGLYLDQVAEPVTPNSVEHIVRVLRRVEEMPPEARDAATREVVVERVKAWSAAIGTATPEAAQRNLELLDATLPLASGDAAGELATMRARVSHGLAESLAADWPLEALALYIDAPSSDDETLRAAGQVVETLTERPSLMNAARSDVERWSRISGHLDELSAVRSAAAASLDAQATLADDAERTGVLASGDVDTLAGYLAEHRGDQEVAVALANARAGAGDMAGALSALESLGEPGWLTPDAQQLRASLLMESGQLSEADALLTSIVSFRLPRMLRASQAYRSAANTEQDRLIDQARSGYLPADLEAKLAGQSEAEQQAIFGEWLRESLQNNSQLTALREVYTAHSAVIPMSLTLGMVKLRRANQAAGDERQALLDEAERAFLAIRQDAEGLPSYHLGLGQVYHRLGRTDDGDGEFKHVMDLGEPQLTLEVCRAYRELGLSSRAKEVAEKVWESQQAPYHQVAAEILGIMAREPDEAETWLKRADQSSPSVRINLREVQAQRFAREGKLRQADRAMAEVAAYYAKNANSSAAAANNAAVAYQARFNYTGDKKHLLAASQSFDKALRLEPDNGLLINNTAEAYQVLARVEILDTWLDISDLAPDADKLNTLVRVLARGPQREALIGAIGKSAALRRSLTLAEQYMVLAPQDVAGYELASDWYNLQANEDKLSALRDAVVRQGTFDTAERDQRRARARAGEYDDQVLASVAEDLDVARKVVAKAGRRGPDRAAAELLVGTLLIRRGVMQSAREDLDAAVEAFRRADRAWPELGAGTELADALVLLAIVKASEDSPELAAAWEAERRVYSVPVLLHRLLSGPHGDSVRDALRAQPEIAEAARLSGSLATLRPRLQDWVLGRVAGDQALEAAGAAWFGARYKQLAMEITARLAPNAPDATATLEIMQAGPGN